MVSEYLLFNILVAGGPLLLTLMPAVGFARRGRRLLGAALIVAIPFVIWDAAVTGRHWWFDGRYTMGFRPFGLPLEEVLFFLSVPYACGFLWETVMRPARPQLRAGTASIYVAAALALALGLGLFASGREYTGLALSALALAIVLDDALGTGLCRQPRFWLFLLAVVGLNFVFNGYLTGRPVVHYDPRYQLDLRIGTVPVEDFVYGSALMIGVVALFHWFEGRSAVPSWLARLIRRRFKGYHHLFHKPRADLPREAPAQREVAVVGGGLAGLSAAALLAERGISVTLLERNSYLGGKLGAWRESLNDGFDARVEHGFHAFFGHYYNLNAFLERLGITNLEHISSYTILGDDGRRFFFDQTPRPPVLNLLDLARKGVYSLPKVAFGAAGPKLEALLRYDPEQTYAQWDDVSFAEFARQAALPKNLMLIFTTFARAFFANPERLSTAALIKSFHFYYLSHDLGLTYRYINGAYERELLQPIADYLKQRGVSIETNSAVESIEARDGRLQLADRQWDDVVLATDVRSTKHILERSPDLSEQAPQLTAQMGSMHAGERYAVLRLWVDVPGPSDLPVFVATERQHLLDAVAFIDRVDPEMQAWGQANAGGVLELHCYAVPDAVPDNETIRRLLIEDLQHHLGQYADMSIEHEHLQVRDDFAAFHVGLGPQRPGPITPVENLYFAGDWVALPLPAMLMEAAHTSALLAANHILEKTGAQTHPVAMVPQRGLLADVPQRPGR